MMGIRPLGDRVVIRKMEAEEKTQGRSHPDKFSKGTTAGS